MVKARTRKVLKQVESADPVTGNCWQLLRALGRFAFDEKEKAEIAASIFMEVFSSLAAKSGQGQGQVSQQQGDN